MKRQYIITIGVLIILATALEYFLIFSQGASDTKISDALQSVSVFVALIIAVIAMSIADPKVKKANIEIEQSVDEDNVNSYSKSDLPSDLQLKFESFPDPITSHRVQFKITNISGFTLKKSTLTFRLPIEKQHPHRVGRRYTLTFNSNIHNPQSEFRLLEFADSCLLSTSNLPYWNNGDEITIWVRMILDDGQLEPFTVEVSLNSENAEGITTKGSIEPRNFVI